MNITRGSFLKGLLALPVAAMLPWSAPKAVTKSEPPKPQKLVGGGEFRKGDVITFSGVYEVNPVTKKSTELLKRFMVISEDPLRFI